MKVVFDKSFSKSLDKLKNKQVKERLIRLIEKCEDANNLSELSNIKKMTSFISFYRFKIGDYRVGVEVEDDSIYFIIVAHRKDIYNVFP